MLILLRRGAPPPHALAFPQAAARPLRGFLVVLLVLLGARGAAGIPAVCAADQDFDRKAHALPATFIDVGLQSTSKQ